MLYPQLCFFYINTIFPFHKQLFFVLKKRSVLTIWLMTEHLIYWVKSKNKMRSRVLSANGRKQKPFLNAQDFSRVQLKLL